MTISTLVSFQLQRFLCLVSYSLTLVCLVSIFSFPLRQDVRSVFFFSFYFYHVLRFSIHELSLCLSYSAIRVSFSSSSSHSYCSFYPPLCPPIHSFFNITSNINNRSFPVQLPLKITSSHAKNFLVWLIYIFLSLVVFPCNMASGNSKFLGEIMPLSY